MWNECVRFYAWVKTSFTGGKWAAGTSWAEILKSSPVIKDFPRPERSKKVAQIMSLGRGEGARERPRAIKINNLRESLLCVWAAVQCELYITRYLPASTHLAQKWSHYFRRARSQSHLGVKILFASGPFFIPFTSTASFFNTKKLSMEPPFGRRFCHYQHTHRLHGRNGKEKSLPYKNRISLNTRRQKGAVPSTASAASQNEIRLRYRRIEVRTCVQFSSKVRIHRNMRQ